jgi:hypothetical protein
MFEKASIKQVQDYQGIVQAIKKTSFKLSDEDDLKKLRKEIIKAGFKFETNPQDKQDYIDDLNTFTTWFDLNYKGKDLKKYHEPSHPIQDAIDVMLEEKAQALFASSSSVPASATPVSLKEKPPSPAEVSAYKAITQQHHLQPDAGGRYGYKKETMLDFLKDIRDLPDYKYTGGQTTINNTAGDIANEVKDYLTWFKTTYPASTQKYAMTPVKGGKGIGIPPPSHWTSIGQGLHLHTTKLGQGILSLSKMGKNGSLSKVASLKNRAISDNFKEALLEVLKDKKLPDLSELDEAEKAYLYQILQLALPGDVIKSLSVKQQERIKATKEAVKHQVAQRNLKYRVASRIQPMAERLKLLVGESMAGNNGNMEIVAEATGILNKLIKAGVMTREEALKVMKLLR